MFTKEIISDIDLLKGQVKTYRKLTETINKKHKTEFSITQIIYQVDKLMKGTFGKAQDDAYLFIKLAEKETAEEGYFNYKVDRSSHFEKAIYLSKAMLLYSNYFLDIVIVDATYKRNRFNLPLINVIGINNYGQNIMLAFGLLSNETAESYVWFFSELKKAWGTNKPVNFIIDGCNEMKQGIF